ncbi:MAG: hypothetical protein KI790_03125 [Cyclobacteriaceae bacterium]|nr:hypothetical protein [Cyclobacteriaceae bacterium HetDA_MAG_MS6]
MSKNIRYIDAMLNPFRKVLGSDFQAYRNHACRVYSYACILLLMRENQKLALVAAFHDLDIWYSSTMDYLSGSSKLAKHYASDRKLPFLEDEIDFMISSHHSLKRIKGNIEAEAFRKADLIDLTAGLLTFNLPRSMINYIERKYPRHKFSRMMFRKAITYAFSHPRKPFPMFK